MPTLATPPAAALALTAALAALLAGPAGAEPGGAIPFLDTGTRPIEAPRRPRLQERQLVVGQPYPDAHIVTAPGLYGLNDPPAGEAYAVLGNKLVRLDRKSFVLRSVLRTVVAILD